MERCSCPEYKESSDAITKSLVDQKCLARMVKFALKKCHSESEAIALAKRHTITQDISTWEIFTGNGMTLDTNMKGGSAYGPAEVFTFDKKPLKLGDLEKQHAVKRISTAHSYLDL